MELGSSLKPSTHAPDNMIYMYMYINIKTVPIGMTTVIINIQCQSTEHFVFKFLYKKLQKTICYD